MLHMHNPCLSRPWGLCHPPTTHSTYSHTFWKAWPMLMASHQHHSPMPCIHHSIITAAQPYLALQPPSPHIRNKQLSHQCHTPSHRVNTTYCCPSSKPSLPIAALLYQGLGVSYGARCLHMLPLITTYRSNSTRET